MLLEILYTMLTGKPPLSFHDDIEAFSFARAGDTKKSITLWAEAMAPEISDRMADAALITELVRYGALIVIEAKVATCQACGDAKGAEKIRQVFRS